MKVELEKVNCDFCGSDEYSFFAEQKDVIHNVNNTFFQVVSCNKCGLKFTNPRPTKKTISYFYSNKYSFHSGKSKFLLLLKNILESIAQQYLIRKISWIFPRKINLILINFLKPKIKDPALDYIFNIKNNKKNLKFLDIGCGSGLSTNFWGSKSSLLELSKKNIEVSGVEPSLNARNILSSYGIKVFSEIENINKEHKFDIIRLNWSLEHVHSPKKYFEFIEKYLSENGIAIICVPNINGLLYRLSPSALELPVHLFHFDINSLKNYATKFNLNVKKFLTFSYPGMYLFAEKIGLISKKFNFSKMSLSKAHDFSNFHTLVDNIGFGNDILLILKKQKVN